MTSDIEEDQQSLPGPPDADESNFSTACANDIQAQHSNLADPFEGPSSQASHPPQWNDGEAADTISENKTGQGQTTPGDHGSVNFDDDL
jgi:hypothetical protein